MLLNYFSNEIIIEIAVKLGPRDCASFIRTNSHVYNLLHSYFYRKAARLVMLGSTYISVLHWAAAYGHDRVVGWLLERGADPAFHDYLGITPLHFAAGATRENVGVIKRLLEGGSNFIVRGYQKTTVLHLAAKGGHVETVKLLLEQAVGVDRVILFAKNLTGVAPLHIAAELGHEPVARLFLEHGANIASITDNRHGEYTALHLACMGGDEATVALLLEKGADPNVRSGQQKGFRSTPLHWIANYCCRIGSSDHGQRRPHHLVKLLLEMGANIMATDMHGRTPFHWLTRSSRAVRSPNRGNEARIIQIRLTRMLLKKGADINARDNNGYTTLHLAVVGCEEDLVQTLLAYGADKEIADYTGKTPFRLAMGLELSKIANILLQP